MKHSFILTNDSNKCNKCHRPEIDHTDFATCESCPTIGPCELYPDINGSLLCQECIDKEETLRLSPEMQQKRVDELRERSKREQNPSQILLNEVKNINNHIQTRSDVFNAKTIAIKEIQLTIDADDSVTDKHFTLASALTDQLNGIKSAIFSKGEELTILNNEQNAVQTYLNTLLNKLRVEQRDKLKLADINYQPNPTKIVKPRSAPVKKFDKAELFKYAAESGFPSQALQQVCISKNMTPEQAAKHLTDIVNGLNSTENES